MAGLKVASANVNGLQDPHKRRRVFQHFRDSLYDIILLQETHVQALDVIPWNTEWRSPCYWNPGPSPHSCGVGILFNNKTSLQPLQVSRDACGRVLAVTLRCDGHTLNIVNVYAPDRPADRPHFFKHLSPYLSPTHINIVGGDFNVVADPTLDRAGGTVSAHHTQGMSQLDTVLTTFHLVDVWRTARPTAREFTWRSPHYLLPQIKSRLDRFYAPPSILLRPVVTEFYINTWSDHSYITFEFTLASSRPPGSPYWKLNTQVLEEPDYIDAIAQLLTYHRGCLPDYPDIACWWDGVKLAILSFTQTYCTDRNHRRRDAVADLKRRIHHFGVSTAASAPEIDRLYNELHHLQNVHRAGVIIRSREKVVLNEEKPTKFFYQLEHSNRVKHNIVAVHTPNGPDVTDNSSIALALHDFYQDLYAKRPADPVRQAYFLDQLSPRLTDVQAQSVDRPITSPEIHLTIQQMGLNKSPGCDGLPVEFYLAFWPYIAEDMTALANYIFLSGGSLNYTQSSALITLLYKEGDKLDLANWRPISLLTADYKFIAKTIATRLRPLLSTLIKSDQTCSVPTRSIHTNLYLLRDVITYAHHKRQPTYILSLDFQKAFDMIDHDYMLQTLTRFNFGPIFLRYIRNIYTDITSNVLNNGYLTCALPIKRGIRQGCPLSLSLYCMVAETVASAIRNHTHIRGVFAPGRPATPLKLTQYADDTTILTTRQHSLTQTFDTFRDYEAASGCRLNPSKIRGLAIAGPVPQLPLPIQWHNPDGVKILGLHFFDDLLHLANFNWTKVIRKLGLKLALYRSRSLSLRGKVILLNSMALSRIWFLSTVIAMPTWALRSIESQLFKFLWDDKGVEPVPRNTLYRPLCEGGLGLLHPQRQNIALRMKFFLHITDPSDRTPWTYYGRYWMASSIHRFHPRWSFLSANNVAKFDGTDPPLYYKCLRNALQIHLANIVALPSPAVKNLYDILQTFHYRNHVILPTLYWNGTFSRILPWPELWRNTFASYATGKPHDLLFKIFHNCLPTGVRLQRNLAGRTYYHPMCSSCPQIRESILHIFASCTHSARVWRHYAPVYALLQPAYPFHIPALVLTLNTVDPPPPPLHCKLLLTVSTYILAELWTCRNRMKYDHVLPNFRRSVSQISYNVEFCVRAHFQHHLAHHSLNVFEEKFCIANALCYVRGRHLVFTIPRC